MKKSVLLFFCFLLSHAVFSQRKVDIGLLAGTDFYLGDINTSKLFYSPQYFAGPIVRYNFNERFSLRGQVLYARLKGSDNDFDRYITNRPFPTTFSVSLLEIGSQLEYNFFDYITGVKAGEWTPYIFGGIGYSFLLSQSVQNQSPGVFPESHGVLPFGVGTKLNLTRRLSGGLEFSMNKSFGDRLDGVTNPIPDSETFLYNNDWYSFFGLFITYKFFKFAADCPAYD